MKVRHTGAVVSPGGASATGESYLLEVTLFAVLSSGERVMAGKPVEALRLPDPRQARDGRTAGDASTAMDDRVMFIARRAVMGLRRHNPDMFWSSLLDSLCTRGIYLTPSELAKERFTLEFEGWL